MSRFIKIKTPEDCPYRHLCPDILEFQCGYNNVICNGFDANCPLDKGHNDYKVESLIKDLQELRDDGLLEIFIHENTDTINKLLSFINAENV